jgi:hypothetical protein
LAEAAARLGLSAEALRQRVMRGEAHALIRDGEYFVYVGETAAERRFGGGGSSGGGSGGAPDAAPATAGAPPADGTLPVVVEFQKMELTRLLRDNERLNARLDQLMDEIRHLRDMQQREQVLRQQEQGLRKQIQDTFDQLAGRLALPPPNSPPISPANPAPDVAAAPQPRSQPASRPAPYLAPHLKPRPATAAKPDHANRRDARPELVLTRTVTAQKPPGDSRARPGPGSGSGQRPGTSAAYLATGRYGQWRREPHAVMPKAAPVPSPVPIPPPNPVPSPTAAPASGAPASVENGGIAPEEAAELAGILQDIGQSLRDSEAFRRFPPIKPNQAPQRAGDRRAGDAPRAGTQAAADALPAEEMAMLAILESMGPTIEDRRAAAGRMRRLLRSRLSPHRHEP